MGEVTAVPTTRDELLARLDRVVRENRFTIAVVFPATGAVMLVAGAEGWLPGPVAFNPLLVLTGVAVMRAPLAVGIVPAVDRRAAAGIGVVCAYAYAIEGVGVATGWPYGEFAYGVGLGPTAGGVPLALPAFFVPLVLNAYLLCLLLLGGRADRAAVRLPAVVAVVVVTDLVLDPGAVALGFWTYAGGGPFYGVPVSNFAGWALSATVAVVVVDLAFARPDLRARLADCPYLLDDLVSFAVLWGGVNAWYGHALPVVLAGLFGLGLGVNGRLDVASSLR